MGEKMLKYLLVTVSILAGAVSAAAQSGDVRIVALVLSNNGTSESLESIVLGLESLDAQVLRVDQPNASEMRSVLKRFADAAIENDVAMVYIDGAILRLEGREFVAPSGLELRRKTDLLTLAIPISAFARAAALAGYGGAVMAHSTGAGISLVDGVTLAQTAPEYRVGVAPIMVAADQKDALVSSIFAQEAVKDEIDLTELMTALATREGITVSHLLDRSVMLRTPPAVVPAVAPVVVVEPVPVGEAQVDPSGQDGSVVENLPQVTEEPVIELPQTDVVELPEVVQETVEADAPAPLSLEMLQVLQNGLSRLDKRKIQRGLALRGHYTGLLDGVFGRQTARAISAYQEEIGAEVTGVLTVGQLTEFQ